MTGKGRRRRRHEARNIEGGAMFNPRVASHLIYTACVLGLAACGSTPGYMAADGPDDLGHYSTRLDDDRYRIVYNGGRSTGLNTSRDYALLRAAELTLRDGYDWFEVIDRETVTVTDHGHGPETGFGIEQTYYVERSCGLLSCSQSVRPSTTTRLDVDSSRPVTKHSHMLEIVMGKGKIPETGGNYYDAASLAESLSEVR
jgi:hypothetical protein